jgi:glycosyltransferase involved in cell wall biosynthesis
MKKKELGISQDKIILLSSGELINRKNHETVIRSIVELKNKYPNSFSTQFQYIICGHGKLDKYLHELVVKLDVSDCISFLGYREDMMEILQIADVFIFPSYQEGLPMALLEAMASGIPIICSDIRGNRDLMSCRASQKIHFCDGGIMVKKADDISAYSEAIHLLTTNYAEMKKYGEWNKDRAKYFSKDYVEKCMKNIYRRWSY